MDLFSVITGDPVIAWTWRALFFACVAYVLWAFFRRRSQMGAAIAAAWSVLSRFGNGLWLLWKPLVLSRTVIGGAIMYADLQMHLNLPDGVRNAALDVAMVLIGTAGFVLVTIGRVFARGPIHLNTHSLMPPGAQAELDAAHASPEHSTESFREFMDKQPGDHVIGFRVGPLPKDTIVIDVSKASRPSYPPVTIEHIESRIADGARVSIGPDGDVDMTPGLVRLKKRAAAAKKRKPTPKQRKQQRRRAARA